MDTEEVKLIEPTKLYTLLNQYLFESPLGNPRYLLFLDARSKEDYNECHIIMSKRMKTNANAEFVVPYDSEVECQENIVVYDSNTSSMDENTDAMKCALALIKNGSRLPIKLVKGGYELFSRLYPFLRTQRIIWMPRELAEYHPYPLEVIPQFLYLGDSRHSCKKEVQKQLKIKAHVNCTLEPDEIFNELGVNLFQVPVQDDPSSDISIYLQDACSFINDVRGRPRQAVLVYSHLGISRSVSVVLAFLILYENHTLKTAWDFLGEISQSMRPNRGFVHQLADLESKVRNPPFTDVEDPYF